MDGIGNDSNAVRVNSANNFDDGKGCVEPKGGYYARRFFVRVKMMMMMVMMMVVVMSHGQM